MGEPSIELVYFDGCPNVEKARSNLLAAAGPGAWREWNLASAETPEPLRAFGSPTVLVDGRDVTGKGGGNAAMACRADGAPSERAIREAIQRLG